MVCDVSVHERDLAELGQVAGGVAHDFANLLAAIRAYAELALGHLDEPSPARRHVAELLSVCDSGRRLTRQLLACDWELRTEAVDLGEVVTATARMLAPLLPASIAVSTRVPDERVLVAADRAQLEQVVVNLVLNARDAMPDGGRLTLTVEAGERCVLTVADTGGGIDDHVRARLFEPFFTTKGTGTGLGLPTVARAVRAAGGAIDVVTAAGQGSAFRVSLPLAA